MPDTQDLAAVEALLEERNAIAGWLARLEEQGSDVPQAVLDRVRQDYRKRLDGLTDQLRQHANTIGSRLADDRSEAQALMERARRARESLAEVELRHGVGEYDDERFESERQRHVDELADLEESIGEVADRITKLEEVHASVTAPAEPGGAGAVAPVLPEEPETVPAEPEPWPEEAPPEPQPAAQEEPTASAGPDAVEPVDDDEADDLLSIFDRAEEDDDEEPAGDAGDPSRTGATPSFGPLSFTPSGNEPPRPERPVVPPSAPPLGFPPQDQKPRFMRSRDESGAAEAKGPAATRSETIRVVHDPDPILPEVPTDTSGELIARTLRCGECGAMNRPLEWYCEKCGAELTAV